MRGKKPGAVRSQVEWDIMKNIKSVLISLLLLLGVFGAAAAQAYPGHFYGPRVGVGLYVDPWPAFYPWAYAPYGYYGGYYGGWR